MNFYTFSQNNTGGSFDLDKNLGTYTVIQADSQDLAIEKAYSIGIYFDGVKNGIDCDCCGDRWHEPEVYSYIYINQYTKPSDYRIHLMDNTIYTLDTIKDIYPEYFI